MPRVLIAPDSFKGSLTALEAAHEIERGLLKSYPTATIRQLPLSDGGEGVLSVLLAAVGSERGKLIEVSCHDPLGRPLVAPWLKLGNTGVVSAAQAAGLMRLTMDERNPIHTCSRGFGEQALDAIAWGVDKCVFALGGSAVVDGGMGFARAFGWQFLDDNHTPLPPGGGSLRHLSHIVAPTQKANIPFEVWVDVDNPLCGQRGAAAVYGPQKGANPSQVAILEEGLQNLVRVAKKSLPSLCVEEASSEGGGSAGGLGFALRLFMGAQTKKGSSSVLDWVDFAHHVDWADLVISGEGRFDEQTLSGKLVSSVSNACLEAGKPLWVVAGDSDANWDAHRRVLGIAGCTFLTDRTHLQDAIDNAKMHLSEWSVYCSRFKQASFNESSPCV